MKENLINTNDLISPIISNEWESKAERPKDSRLLLDKNNFSLLGLEVKSWEEGIDEIIDNYLLKRGNNNE